MAERMISNHHAIQLMVVGREHVPVINAGPRMLIPMQTFVLGLGMHWPGQAVKLERLKRRLRPDWLTVSDGKQSSYQPHLAPGPFYSFLHTLRPTRPQLRARVESLQDKWEAAVLNHLGINEWNRDLPGGWTATFVKEIQAPMQRDIARLYTENARLLAALRANKIGPIGAPNKKRPFGPEEFTRMKHFADTGMDDSEIGKQMGCSSAVVYLFLTGQYDTLAARESMALLRADGWTPREKQKSKRTEIENMPLRRELSV